MSSGLQGGKPVVGTVNKTRDDVTDHPVPHPRSTPTGNYIFTLTPTFTQGIILGQIPILLLAYLILFFGSKSTLLPEGSLESGGTLIRPGFSAEKFFSAPFFRALVNEQDGDFVESVEWLNFLLKQIVDEYRFKFSATDNGLEEEEESIALRQIQDLANEARPQTLFGHIYVHSVGLGMSAPQFSNVKISNAIRGIQQVEFNLNYTDTASISLSTTAFINFPFPRFAEVPISLMITGPELFSCKIVVTPPEPTPSTNQLPIISDEFLALTISIPPSSVSLRINIDSAMGPLPSLLTNHILQEQIEAQVKTLISEQGTWQVLLPGISKLRAKTNGSSDSGNG